MVTRAITGLNAPACSSNRACSTASTRGERAISIEEAKKEEKGRRKRRRRPEERKARCEGLEDCRRVGGARWRWR